MHGDQVEELDDAGGIDLFAAAVAALDRFVRVAQVHDGDRDLVGAELLRANFRGLALRRRPRPPGAANGRQRGGNRQKRHAGPGAAGLHVGQE